MDDRAWTERAVQTARQVCAQDRIPERAALQNLLRFAQAHDTIAEIELFIRYQGARAGAGQRDFFTSLAKHVVDLCDGDPERARRFLGYVVRAGVIQRESQRGQGAQRGHTGPRPTSAGRR